MHMNFLACFGNSSFEPKERICGLATKFLLFEILYFINIKLSHEVINKLNFKHMWN